MARRTAVSDSSSSSTTIARVRGTVKWFNDAKGYGFITPDGGGKDLFVHWSALTEGKGRRSLEDGQHVEYEVTAGEKGLQAANVTTF